MALAVIDSIGHEIRKDLGFLLVGLVAGSITTYIYMEKKYEKLNIKEKYLMQQCKENFSELEKIIYKK
jgi:hypothetical protein